ncbi:hypothetical protein K443DRAFT_119154 [Laccaria amethystina LaAM-08-1]|uniref:CWF21 domain-containing protein n=1 Tax=Laccaria amethystina LaAM-08-1 TaxID=1095629 RepID=A0A0C9Y3V2_9AGAR|nr:hypothetical protein K443DRAFT_119154 [Laccaria amethystina LaAM-08-1]
MYNGIGLTTPRGSGTSGYVVRNLSTLRSHDTSYDRASPWDAAPPKHREPDQGILEHERKRNVELKCLELQLKLEDDEVDEDDIQAQVAALRAKLLENLAAQAPAAKGFKLSDTHGMALAKKAELSKMARAFGTRSDYQEGESFDREKQEENKIKRVAEREERERQKAEERAKMNEQKAKWEAEKREKDRLRRREEDRIRKEREAGGLKRKERMGQDQKGLENTAGKLVEVVPCVIAAQVVACHRRLLPSKSVVLHVPHLESGTVIVAPPVPAHHLLVFAGVSFLAHLPDPQVVRALALQPPGDLVRPFLANPVRAPPFEEGFLLPYEIVHCLVHVLHFAVPAPHPLHRIENAPRLQPRRFARVSALALLQIDLHLRKGVRDLRRRGHPCRSALDQALEAGAGAEGEV